MKNIIAILLALIICLGICACSTTEADARITTEQKAISALKNDEEAIKDGFLAYELGFFYHKDPVFTVCTAEKNNDNTWTVTLKGSISGYTDQYKQKYDSCGFIFKAKVSVDGKISERKYTRVD